MPPVRVSPSPNWNMRYNPTMTKQVKPATITAREWNVQTLFRFDPDKRLDSHDRSVLLQRMVAFIRQKLVAAGLREITDYDLDYNVYGPEKGYQINARVYNHHHAMAVQHYFDDVLIDDADKFNITRY